MQLTRAEFPRCLKIRSRQCLIRPQGDILTSRRDLTVGKITILMPKGTVGAADGTSALADERQTRPDHLYGDVDRVPREVAVVPDSCAHLQAMTRFFIAAL